MSAADATQAAATAQTRIALSAGLEPAITALRQHNGLRRIFEICFFAVLWLAGVVCGVRGLDASGPAALASQVLGIAVSAAALNAFYLLSHEGHHHLLFRRRAMNHAANVALCVPLLHSPTAYRVLHDLHHRYLGGHGDPDEYRNYTNSPRLRWTLQWVRLTMGTLVYMPLIPIVAWRRAGRADRRWIVLEYGAMSVVWVTAFALVPIGVLLQAWLVPGIVVGYISAVRALAQHALTDSRDPLLASRSVRSNRLVSFLLLNENYHLEHHLFPDVPSYRLPALRELIRPRLPRCVDAVSYTRFLAGFFVRTVRGDESVLGAQARRAPVHT
jgi:fatty acid desaturase